MSAIFEMSIPTETLSHEEVEAITGAARKGEQIQWLASNGWIYCTTRAGEPVVGRLYARLKMAGINPQALQTSGGWVPDLTQVR
jgi:Domain of unknown function (DUF4224)